ncbi:hypothetical protein BGZ76_007588, partial [Entomortierella beljakovae]
PETLATPQAVELCRSLGNLIKKHWSYKNIPEAVLLSLFLNPGFAALPLLDDHTFKDGNTLRVKAIELATKALVSIMQDSTTSPVLFSPKSINPKVESVSKPNLKVGVDSAFSNQYFQVSAGFVVSAYCISVHDNAESLKHYLDSPDDYWNEVGSEPMFTSLARVARSCLSVQATSSESERLF